jgi:hypothetical protein
VQTKGSSADKTAMQTKQQCRQVRNADESEMQTRQQCRHKATLRQQRQGKGSKQQGEGRTSKQDKGCKAQGSRQQQGTRQQTAARQKATDRSNASDNIVRECFWSEERRRGGEISFSPPSTLSSCIGFCIINHLYHDTMMSL